MSNGGIWDTLNQKKNNITSKKENNTTSQEDNKLEERVKRTYNLPVSTIGKLYELKSKYPTKDIEVIVKEAIQEKHEKEFSKEIE